MTIAENLRQLRLDNHMTQEEAAGRVGVTRQTISSYESGRTRPDVEMLMRLGEVYQTDLDGILYGQSRSLKAAKRIYRAAFAVFVLVTLSVLISSLFLWSANHFFPMPLGQLTEEGKAIFAVRQKLTGAWEKMGELALTITLFGSLLLAVLLFEGKCRVPLRKRLIFALSLSAAVIVPSAVLGTTDQVFSVADYVITPVLIVGRLVVVLILELAAEGIRGFRRQRKGI